MLFVYDDCNGCDFFFFSPAESVLQSCQLRLYGNNRHAVYTDSAIYNGIKDGGRAIVKWFYQKVRALFPVCCFRNIGAVIYRVLPAQEKGVAVSGRHVPLVCCGGRVSSVVRSGQGCAGQRRDARLLRFAGRCWLCCGGALSKEAF